VGELAVFFKLIRLIVNFDFFLSDSRTHTRIVLLRSNIFQYPDSKSIAGRHKRAESPKTHLQDRTNNEASKQAPAAKPNQPPQSVPQPPVLCEKMAPLTRPNNAHLSKKIATLQLELAPLVPLPEGPPHPSFPKTLLAFHLLTEDELDSIAHHYHQSTPGPWTQHYPALMNWDKEFLAKPKESKMKSASTAAEVDAALEADVSEKEFLETLMETAKDLRSATPPSSSPTTLKSSDETTESSFGTLTTSPTSQTSNPFAGLSDKDRIRIKRRKVGKFIGLVGMETPVEEIAGRIQASLDRAVERSREELRRNEEVMLRRKKMA
jgi:hypothetical protein